MLNKTMKLFGVMAVCIVLCMVSACQKEDAVTTVEYAFWGNPESIGVEKEIIEEFERENPDIKIKVIATPYPDHHQKLLTLIAGGKVPDVMRIDSYFFSDFMRAQAFIEIDDLIAEDSIAMSAYYQAGVEDCCYNGKYYGLPWATAPLFIFLNLDAFEAAGVPVPEPDWTWSDFVEVCKKLNTGEGTDRVYGYASDFQNQITRTLPYIWGNGGDLFSKDKKTFTLNKQPAVDKLQEIADLIQADVFPNPSQFPNDQIIKRWFIDGRTAMQLGSTGTILDLQKVDGMRFEVLTLPGGPADPKTTIYKSNIVGISRMSKHKEAAWKFLKFLRAPGEKGEVLYMKAKRIAPTMDDPELWKMYADPAKYPKTVEKIAKLAASEYGHTLPLRSGWAEIEAKLKLQFDMIFAGEVSARDAMNEIAPQIQEIMDRTGK